MKVNITTKIGHSSLAFQVEGGDIKEALAAAAFFTDLPSHCGKCGSDDVVLGSNRDKDQNVYVKIRCNACHAASSLGSPKDKVSYWWKDWDIYTPRNQEGEAPKTPAKSAESDDSLPF